MTRTAKMAGFVSIVFAVSAIIGCSMEDVSPLERHSDRHSGKLVITGSSTMAPLVAAIARRFSGTHPGAVIEVQAGGSHRGISDLRKGANDLAMVSRALTEKESDLSGYSIGRDGICLIVHRDNPVQSLGRRQVREIYSGKITNWKEVGGRDSAIVALRRSDGRPSHELFVHYFDIGGIELKAQATVGDNPEAIKAVAGNPDAIVPVSVGEAERDAAHGTAIKLLPVDGVEATRKNVRNGDFPISRALSLVTKETPKGLTRAFIKFSLSPQVTDIVKDYDFVPYLD